MAIKWDDEKRYAITEWLGSESLPDQALWGHSFVTLEYATNLAKATYQIGLEKYGLYTELCFFSGMKNYYVLVQEHRIGTDEHGRRCEETDREVVGITSIGDLGGAALARFLTKWEE